MQKLYYSISEASKIADEEQHILRYWEKEFEQLKPKKNRGGNRIYSERDIYVILTIKKFLREQKLSIKGAKEQLKNVSFESGENTLTKNFEATIKDFTERLDAKKSHNPADILPGGTLTAQEAQDLYLLLKDVLAFLKNS